MATKDQQLLSSARGLRDRATRVLSDASDAGRSAGGQVEKRARALITELRALADEIEGRLTGGNTRKAAAEKAAKTRAANARKRSASAKKGAATRARKTTSSSRSTSSRSTSRSGSTSRKRATAGSRSR
jgi:hypothetical protein